VYLPFYERFMVVDRPRFEAAVARVLAWDFDRLLPCHGVYLPAAGKQVDMGDASRPLLLLCLKLCVFCAEWSVRVFLWGWHKGNDSSRGSFAQSRIVDFKVKESMFICKRKKP